MNQVVEGEILREVEIRWMEMEKEEEKGRRHRKETDGRDVQQLQQDV
jgi:hypothetical protein